jgi:hypothetical protein
MNCRLAIMLVALSLSLPLLVRAAAAAQDDDPEEAPAPQGLPTTTGRDEAQAAVGQRGMIFELHNKARAVVPPRLPIGDSRRIRFAVARGRFVPARVAAGFRRIGPVLQFDAAINASSNPVVVSIRQPTNPARPNLRVVLAMEQATICRDGLEPLPSSNLCSTWELLDARYDESERRLVAEIRAPGGYRIVFGTVPREP